jgi:hypothetical protein
MNESRIGKRMALEWPSLSCRKARSIVTAQASAKGYGGRRRVAASRKAADSERGWPKWIQVAVTVDGGYLGQKGWPVWCHMDDGTFHGRINMAVIALSNNRSIPPGWLLPFRI